MEEIRAKLTKIGKELEDLVLKIAVKANEHRRYPHYEQGDKLDKCAIYTSAAATKVFRAREQL